jgi:hypothetical protein
MTILNKLPICRKSMEKGLLYIWQAEENGERKVVWLNPEEDGFAVFDMFHEEDYWYFDDNLAGWLYGPFTLQPNTTTKRKLYDR